MVCASQETCLATLTGVRNAGDVMKRTRQLSQEEKKRLGLNPRSRKNGQWVKSVKESLEPGTENRRKPKKLKALGIAIAIATLLLPITNNSGPGS